MHVTFLYTPVLAKHNTLCVQGACGNQKASDPLELELIKHGCREPNLNVYKHSKSSYLTNHLASLEERQLIGEPNYQMV